MITLVKVLVALRPISPPSCLDSLKECRKKKLSERSEYQKANFSTWLEQERDYKQAIATRREAVESLDRMGGCSVSKDAKLDWGEDTPW